MDSFDRISAIAHSEAGLVLSRDKAPMVLARIAKRMRTLGLPSVEEYSSLVGSGEGADERREMIFSLTTNVTSFMREAHHIDYLRDKIIPGLARRSAAGERIRIWSAGCSTGQEPYTIAMAVLDQMPSAAGSDLRILATDIDPYVLQHARRGVYPAEALSPLPERWRKSFAEAAAPGPGAQPMCRMKDPVRKIIAFRELNLVHEWPMRGLFDVIFCRNVVIYFDRDTQAKLWRRFAGSLAPDGHLFLGHSERIDGASANPFRTVGTTIYQRADGLDRVSDGAR